MDKTMSIQEFRDILTSGTWTIICGQHYEGMTDEQAYRVASGMVQYLHLFGGVLAQAILHKSEGQALLAIADMIRDEEKEVARWGAELDFKAAGAAGNA